MTEYTSTTQESLRNSPKPRLAWPQLTTQPETNGEQCLNSAVVFLVLMAYWAFSDLMIAIFPPGGRPYPPTTWDGHLLFTLAGLVAIWCLHRTGFPAAWDTRFSAVHRLLLPMLMGVGFGCFAIATELIGGSMKSAEVTLGTAFTIGFPGSLLVYSAGATVMEMLYLLVPLPLLLWLIVNVILRGRRQTPTFWGLALLSSAVEPLFQGMQMMALTGGTVSPGIFTLYCVETFGHNLASAYFLRRYGLLAAVLVRFGHYMIWHVLYGNFLA